MTGVGAMFVVLGGVFLSMASEQAAGDRSDVPGWIMIAGGGVVAVTGVALLAHGLSIEVRQPNEGSAAAENGVRWRSFGILPRPGGAAVGASFAF